VRARKCCIKFFRVSYCITVDKCIQKGCILFVLETRNKMYKYKRLPAVVRAFYIAQAFVINHRGPFVVGAIVGLIIISGFGDNI